MSLIESAHLNFRLFPIEKVKTTCKDILLHLLIAKKKNDHPYLNDKNLLLLECNLPMEIVKNQFQFLPGPRKKQKKLKKDFSKKTLLSTFNPVSEAILEF